MVRKTPGEAASAAEPNAYTPLHADASGRLRLSSDPGAAAGLELVHEDDDSRILRYVIRPGERTGWHTHDLDFITIHLSVGEMVGYSVTPGEDRGSAVAHALTFTPGRVVPHHAPLEHDAVNNGTSDIVLLEIEFKSAPVVVAERRPG